MGGLLGLTQLGSKSDGLNESERLARYSKGWQFPHAVCVEPSKGYWRMCVLPKIDFETGRAEYRGALPKALASFGVSARPVKSGRDLEVIPKGRFEEKYKQEGKKRNTLTAGAQDETMLYPTGKRLLKTERNLPMAQAPRMGEEVFFLDRNSHGGCSRGVKCDRKHDKMSGRKLHWEVTAETIRRGGYTKRPTRIAPGNIDGMVGQLRGRNKRIHGGKPSRRRRLGGRRQRGGNAKVLGRNPPTGRTAPGWKVPKRELGRNEALGKSSGEVSPQPPRGEGGVAEASSRRTPGSSPRSRSQDEETRFHPRDDCSVGSRFRIATSRPFQCATWSPGEKCRDAHIGRRAERWESGGAGPSRRLTRLRFN